MARVKQTVKKLKHPDEHYLGNEPSPRTYGSSDTELLKALNWYAYFVEVSEHVSWLYDWCRDAMPEYYDRLLEVPRKYVTSHLIAMARMSAIGNTFSPDTTRRFHEKVRVLCEAHPKVQEKVPEDGEGLGDQDTGEYAWKPPSKQRLRARDFAAEVMEAHDQYVFSGFKDNFSTYGMLQAREAPAAFAEYLLERSADYHAFALEVVAGTCPQLNEGYRNYTRAQKRLILENYEQIIDDCNRYLGNKKATRKPRKVKEKAVTDLVSEVRYMRECNELKLRSIDPGHIVGASALWTYNHKYRRLSVLRAAQGGLTVRGTTVYNLDLEKSESKTLRKPKEVLPRILDSQRAMLDGIMRSVATESSVPNGRLNEDTVILRAIR